MFVPDNPINSAAEDTLGRKVFAHKLGETVRDWKREESIVVALYGPWGNGKTSVLNMAIEHIIDTSKDREERDRPIIIRFNPWNFSEQNQILDAFFREIYATLRSHLPKDKEFQKKLTTFARILGSLEEVPWLGPWPARIGKAILTLAPDKTLEQLKADLSQSFRELHRRIVFVLDDIDRLNQPEIRQLFQLIKLNADFPNTIYIAAFDRDVVEKALTTNQGVSGRDYLEKIVQVGFNVPKVDSAYITGILDNGLEELFSERSIDIPDPVRWGNLYHSGFRPWFSTLRDVKRFVNGLAFNLNIISAELNPIDFIGLEVLRVFVPEVYEEIALNKNLFTNTSMPNFGQSLNYDQLKEQFEQVFAKAGNDIELARAICKQLFPKLKTAYERSHFGPDSQRIWRKERRICATDVFEKYFLLGTPQGDVSQVELRQIASNSESPDALMSIFRSMTSEGRIGRLLDLTVDILDELSDDGARTLSQVLLTFGDELPDEKRGLGGTDIKIAYLISKAIMRIKDREERCVWLKRQISAATTIYSVVYLLHFIEPTAEAQEDGLAVERACFSALKETCVARIVAAAESGELRAVKGLDYILFRWRNWTTDLKPLQDFVERMLTTPQRALDFAAKFPIPVTSQAVDDFVATTEWTLRPQDLGAFVDLQRLASILSPLTEQQAAGISERHYIALLTVRRIAEQQTAQQSSAARPQSE